jgi:hypothetical protein
MMEGSGFGSGSAPLTNGSGSGKRKNLRILRIRIPDPDPDLKHWSTAFDNLDSCENLQKLKKQCTYIGYGFSIEAAKFHDPAIL